MALLSHTLAWEGCSCLPALDSICQSWPGRWGRREAAALSLRCSLTPLCRTVWHKAECILKLCTSKISQDVHMSYTSVQLCFSIFIAFFYSMPLWFHLFSTVFSFASLVVNTHSTLNSYALISLSFLFSCFTLLLVTSLSDQDLVLLTPHFCLFL